MKLKIKLNKKIKVGDVVQTNVTMLSIPAFTFATVVDILPKSTEVITKKINGIGRYYILKFYGGDKMFFNETMIDRPSKSGMKEYKLVQLKQ